MSDFHAKDDARTRITRALVRLRSHTEMMGIGSMLNLVHTYEPVPARVCPTMATDGKKVYYNEAFVDSMTDAELRFVLVHEASHISFGHHLRLGNRDPKVANIAMDHVINNLLVQSEAARHRFIVMPVPDQAACDTKYADSSVWGFERVYADIYQKTKQEEQDKNGKPGNQGSGDAGTSSGGDNSQPQNDDQGEAGAGQAQRPDGMGDFSAPGEVWPSPAEDDPVERQAEEARIEEALAQSVFMEKSFGLGGGSSGICGTIRDGKDEDVSSWNWMRELLTDVYSHERTWARPNLVFSDIGYYPARKKSSGTLHAVIDTSGSVTPTEMEIYLANSRKICEDLGIRTLKVAYADSEVRLNDDGEVWTEIEVSNPDNIELKIRGRGGTNFAPIFQAIEEEEEDVTCLVYFTDGWGPCRIEEPDFPVVWASTNGPPRWWKDGSDFERDGWGEFVNIRPTNY